MGAHGFSPGRLSERRSPPEQSVISRRTLSDSAAQLVTRPCSAGSLALQMTTTMHIHFHTGPLSVIVIPWNAVARAFVEPAALMVPPVDAIPLLMMRLLFVSRVIVN